jgi:ATP-dependent Lon protease
MDNSASENSNDASQVDITNDRHRKILAVKPIIEKALKRKRTIKKLINPCEEEYTIDEYEFYHSQPYAKKQNIVNIEKTLLDMSCNGIPTRFKLLLSGLDIQSKAIAMRKMNYLSSLDSGSGEYYKLKNWIDAVIDIPFGKFKELPVSYKSDKTDIKDFLKTTRDRLDSKVYGHANAKEHLIRMLAQWVSKPDSKGMVLGIQGAMGCGKTTLVKEGVCSALGLPFAFVPLGGASDGSYLEGHSYTYEGAVWGKLVNVLMKAKYMNPVIFFDELDKVSTTQKGDEIVNILIHLTDSSQNDKYHDKYFTDFEFDLSHSIIIFSYNDEDSISPILKDRMIRIRTNGYKLQDKIEIALRHMIPEILSEFNMPEGKIKFSVEMIKKLVNYCDDEQGVRNLKRGLHDIVSNINLEMLIGDINDDCVDVKEEHISMYVNKVKKTAMELSVNHMYM